MAETAKKPTIDPAKWKIFLTKIRSGLSLRGAAGIAEIPLRTVRDAIESSPDLGAQMARARGSVEDDYIENLKNAESNCEVAKWTWLLSRKMPGDYSDSGIIREMADTIEAMADENAALRDRVKSLEGGDGAPVG